LSVNIMAGYMPGFIMASTNWVISTAMWNQRRYWKRPFTNQGHQILDTKGSLEFWGGETIMQSLNRRSALASTRGYME
jgi:hypothetical protein